MYIDYRAKEELADRKAMARHPFHEDSFVFQVIHFSGRIMRVESQKIRSNELGLLVEPIYLEHVSFFLDD